MFNGNEKRALMFGSLAHGYTHFYMMIFTATNVIMAKEFGISLSRIGQIGNIHYLLFGVGAIMGGFIINKISARKTMTLSLAGGAIFSLLAGFSPNLLWVIICLAGMGISGSIYHPAGLTLTANVIRSRGRGLAIHGIGGTLGLAISPMIAGIITSSLGWRWAYALLSIPGFLLVLYSTAFKIDETEVIGDGLAKNRKKNNTPLSHPLIFLTLVFMLQIIFGLFFQGTTVFLPAYTAKSLDFTIFGMSGIALGGLVTTISLLFGLVGQILGGEASERIKLYKLQLFVMLFTVPSIFLIGVSRNYLLMIAMVLFSIFGFSWQPIGNGMVAYYTPGKWRGHMYSISFALSFGVGSFASSIAGHLADKYGMNRIFTVMAMIGMLSFIISIPLWILNKKVESE